jgi:hypothetical protein
LTQPLEANIERCLTRLKRFDVRERLKRVKPKPAPLLDDIVARLLLTANEREYRRILFRDFVKLARDCNAWVISPPYERRCRVLLPPDSTLLQRLAELPRFPVVKIPGISQRLTHGRFVSVQEIEVQLWRRLNEFGDELPRRPISLPIFRLPPVDLEAEAAEAAAIIAERKVIRTGLDAWCAIGKSNSFEAWLAIGRALCIGKAWALHMAHTNAAWGSAYSRLFGQWMAKHGFGTMNKHTRSWALMLFENANEIERWRSGLPEKERRRLRHPQSVVRKWRQSCITRGNGHRCPADLKRCALTAWRRFLIYLEALPPPDRAELWAVVHQTKASDVAA